MKSTENYIISGGLEGKKRLGLLSEVLYSYTHSLLVQNGVSAGTRFLDAGCGGGHVALMVAGIAGKDGHVTAIDFDPAIIALNKKEATESGISNIHYETMSAYDISYQNEFDVAYARFLLSHLTDPLLVARSMANSVKPGGRIIVEDIHFSGHFCYPECKAFDKYADLYTTTARQKGQNANIGPMLPSLLAEAGLQHIAFDVIQPVFNTGSGKWMAYITMDKIKDAVIAQGLADMQTIADILSELEAFTNDENTIISFPRIFRVWGTKGVN